MKLTKSLFILIIFLFTLNAEIFEGLTLITDKGFDSPPPFLSLLIDNDYNIINEWYHDCRATSIAYLMPDSSLILPCSNRLKRIDWDGNIIWDYYINDDEYINHHDIEPLTNGNILVICWELKTKEEAIAAGRQNINGVMSTLVILELRPVGENAAQIIWKWHAWDHLIQDIDSLLPNFGIISENPQLIDINLVENLHNNGDWLHTNSIHYSPVLDQIILSSRFLDEFFVIDHSTSIEEASGHFGGNSEKGGDLLFRWGNPKNYGRGDEFDQILFSQHSVNWIPNGYPGAGNIILFNNHHNNVIEPYHSSVIELVPPIDSDGIYILNENEDFDPESFSWIFLLDYVAGIQHILIIKLLKLIPKGKYCGNIIIMIIMVVERIKLHEH